MVTGNVLGVFRDEGEDVDADELQVFSEAFELVDGC